MSITKIVATPDTLGGAVRLDGHRLRPEFIAQCYREYGHQGLFEAYPHLTNGDLLAACWYMAVNGSKKWRRMWGGWADQNWDAICEGDDTIDLPVPW